MTAQGEAVARQVLDEARRAAGGGAALAAALQTANVGPDSGAYSVSAISNWIKGRTRPPADVLLAAASLYRISLDGPLGLSSTTGGAPTPTPSPVKDTDDVEGLRAAVARLESLVHDNLGSRRTDPAPGDTKDVRAVFATRSEAQAAVPLVRALASAEHVDAMGLGLNAICQGVSDVTLAELLENGLILRCLFLDPEGRAIQAREDEEGHPRGHLSDLSRSNVQALQRVRERLSDGARDRLELRGYDDTVRFNITTFDHHRTLVQPYLPGDRGLDAPTLLIDADEDEPHGVFPVFDQVFTTTRDRARALD
jgi:transcriptional regulator with XRE-family HTH domain